MRKITLFVLVVFWSISLTAQLPPHPGGSTGPGPSDPPVGSPLEGGTLILLALAFGYGNKKVYNYWKTNKEE